MGLKRKLDQEVIDVIHNKEWEKLRGKYGSPDGSFPWPREGTPYRAKVDLIGERNRAMSVLLAWHNRGGEGSAARFLTKYALRLGSADWVLKKFCEEEDAVLPEKTANRKSLYRDFERFAIERVFEQFTTAQLAEQSGFSQATVLKFVKTSPYFHKVKKGLYEARDPSMKSKEK